MPFSVSDVDSKRSGLSPAQKRRWVRTANSVLNRCIADGGSDSSCAPSAIRIANSLFESESDLTSEEIQLLESVEDELMDIDLSIDEATLIGDSLEEGIKTDGVVPIKIIQPGWGSSGFYPADVLERDRTVFEGAQMFWDHPSQTERVDRPERSLKDLAAVIEGPVRWVNEGRDGPGLYAEARVFKPYRETLAELAPHIGVSIRASGSAAEGEADGRKGRIVESIKSAFSVDFVTKPGAGGKILEIFESARGLNQDPHTPEEDSMDLQEAIAARDAAERDRDAANAELEETKTTLEEVTSERDSLKEDVARFSEAQMLTEAKTYARSRIEEAKLPGDAKLPDVTITRLVESLGSNPPTDEDGKINKTKFDEMLVEGIKSEVEYLTTVTGGGKIRGMGGGEGESSHEESQEDFQKRMDSAFSTMGLSESARKHAVGGRN